MKTADYIARILSFVFHPIVMPLYCIALALFTTHLYTIPLQTRLNVLVAIFGITVCLPITIIYILYALKIIADTGLTDKKDRTIPYIAGLLCYFFAYLYLVASHAPDWLLHFVIGGIIAVAVDTIVNFRWKISGHATAMGCAVALVFFLDFSGLNAFDMDFWTYFILLASGAVASARLLLRRHNLEQIGAGFANGLIVTLLSMIFI